MLEAAEMGKMLAYVSSFNEWKKIYEKKKEEFEKYVSKDPERSREELAAEASKVLLDEILKRYDPAGMFPEMKPVIDFARSNSAEKVGEMLGEAVKFYCRQQGSGKSGEEVFKELAYKLVKGFLLKKMLGD